MKFFRFMDNTVHRPSFARGDALATTYTARLPCTACGIPKSYRTGPGAVNIQCGSRWPDLASGGGGCPHLVSERVVSELKNSALSGFEEFPVTIERIGPKKLRVISPPKYFYITTLPGIDVDLAKSGVQVQNLCSECFIPTERTSPRQFVPIYESWTGADIFTIRNYPASMMFCSINLLLLAREHRWTNFRFTPLDAVFRHCPGWKGIDYLGKQWPPQWYPDPPSKGKTLEEWLEIVRTNPHEWHYAYDAVLDFGPPAVEPLLKMLVSEDELAKLNAARALARFPREWGTVLPDEAKYLIYEKQPHYSLSILTPL